MTCPDSYNDDQQGFYYDEARQILKGKLAKPLTEAHHQAISAEARRIFPEQGEPDEH